MSLIKYSYNTNKKRTFIFRTTCFVCQSQKIKGLVALADDLFDYEDIIT